MNAARLRAAGIDYDAGVKRFLGDTDLYELVLQTFLQDTTLERAEAAFSDKQRDALFACVHELKGSSGNADMTVLYHATCALVELLRAGASTDEEIAESFQQFQTAYLSAKAGDTRSIGGIGHGAARIQANHFGGG